VRGRSAPRHELRPLRNLRRPSGGEGTGEATPRFLFLPACSPSVGVQAQAAIERVYYSHQIGTTLSFEEAVPRGVLENKVITYLQQSAALECVWHRPITAEMLRREMERMAGRTRMPERLGELFAALGNDPFLSVTESLNRTPGTGARIASRR
jgi:hypothetical protein